MKTPRSILAATILSASIATSLGLTVPVQEDTFSTKKGTLSTAAGKATSLVASDAQVAFVKFNVLDSATVPLSVQAGNIVSANLRIYIGKAKTPGTFTVHRVTSTWSETAGGAAPSFDPTPLATVPADAQTSKGFVVVDVTGDAATFNPDGYALVSTAGSKLTIPSKESALPACELNIEANYANDGQGNFSIANISTTNLTATSASATTLFTTDVVASGSLTTDGENGGFFVNTGFSSAGNNTTLIGVFTGKNNAGPQLRFQRENDPDFTDIGQDANDNFVVENKFDQTIFRLDPNGATRIGQSSGRLNLNSDGFSDVTANLRAVMGDAALLNYQNAAGQPIGSIAKDGTVRVGGDGIPAQLNVNTGGVANVTVAIQSRSATDVAMLVTDNLGVSLMKVGTFGLEVSNGNAFKPGGGSWAVLSDARLKHAVEPLDGALENLLRLRSVTFEYNDPASSLQPAGRQTGFIAQEVEQVFPDWVSEKADGYKFIAVKGFESLTVQALRELRAEKDAQIRELQARNIDLAAKLEAVETRLTRLAEALDRAPAERTRSTAAK